MPTSPNQPFSLTSIKRFGVQQRQNYPTELTSIIQGLGSNNYTFNTVATYIHDSINNENIAEHAIAWEEALKNSLIDKDNERITLAMQVLGVTSLSEKQRSAILYAHHHIHGDIPFYLLSPKQRADKESYLIKEGGFIAQQADKLVYNVVCGKGLLWFLFLTLLALSGYLAYDSTDGFKNPEKIVTLWGGEIKKENRKGENRKEGDQEIVEDGEENSEIHTTEPEVIDTTTKVYKGTLAKYPGSKEIDLGAFYNLYQTENISGGESQKTYTVPESANSAIKKVTLADNIRINALQLGFPRKGLGANLELTRKQKQQNNRTTGSTKPLSRELHFKFLVPLGIQYEHHDQNKWEISREETLRKNTKRVFGGGNDEETVLAPFYEELTNSAYNRITEVAKSIMEKNHERIAKIVLQNMEVLFIENVELAEGETVPTELIVEFGLPNGMRCRCTRDAEGKTDFDFTGGSALQEVEGNGGTLKQNSKVKVNRTKKIHD